MKVLILLASVAACLLPAAWAIPALWVQNHAMGNCSQNLPIGGRYPSATVGHGAAGPVANDSSIIFTIRDANSDPNSGAVCQGKPVLVQVAWGPEPRAYFLTASDNGVTFTNDSSVQDSLGADGDPNGCTNRVYYKTTVPVAAPPLLAQSASTLMTIPCGTSGPVNLTITTAKGRGMQHLQGTTLVNSVPCGCAEAAGPATGTNATSNSTTTPGGVPTPSSSNSTEDSAQQGETAPGSSNGTTPSSPSSGSSGGVLPPNLAPSPIPSPTPSGNTSSGSPPPNATSSPRAGAASSQQVPMLLGMVMTLLALAAF